MKMMNMCQEMQIGIRKKMRNRIRAELKMTKNRTQTPRLRSGMWMICRVPTSCAVVSWRFVYVGFAYVIHLAHSFRCISNAYLGKESTWPHICWWGLVVPGAEEKIVAVSFCSFVVGETTSGMVDKDEDRKSRECIARWRKKCGIGGFCRLLL